MNSIPSTEDLRYLQNEAKKRLGKAVELPFEHPGNRQFFIIRLVMAVGNRVPPSWTMITGEGAKSKVIWNRNGEDVMIIQNKVKMDAAVIHETAEQRHVPTDSYMSTPGGNADQNSLAANTATWGIAPAPTGFLTAAPEPSFTEAGGFSSFVEPPSFYKKAAPAGAPQSSSQEVKALSSEAASSGADPWDSFQLPAPTVQPAPSTPSVSVEPFDMPFGQAPAQAQSTDSYSGQTVDEVQPFDAPFGGPPSAVPPSAVPFEAPFGQNLKVASPPAAHPGGSVSNPPQYAQPSSPPQFAQPSSPPQFAQPANPPQFAKPSPTVPQFANPVTPPQFVEPATPSQFAQTPTDLIASRQKQDEQARSSVLEPQITRVESKHAANSLSNEPPLNAMASNKPTAAYAEESLFPSSVYTSIDESEFELSEAAQDQSAPQNTGVSLPPPLSLDTSLIYQAQAAVSDPLTGLLSFPAFLWFLYREFARYQRDASPFAVVVFELAVAIGGEVLVLPETSIPMVTDRLNGLCAIVDSATHLGGNEFSVILPAVDGPGAMQFSSALQSALGSGPLTPGAIDEAVLSVFGVASIPETCGNPETLLAAARQAKEMAKTAPQPIVLFPVDSEF